MLTVTLVGLPPGRTGSSVRDPETGITFELNVSHEVDDSTIEERLKSVEQFGYAFWFGDPAAMDVVAPPDPQVSATSIASADGSASLLVPDPTPAAPAASPQ